jgi:hypothetical protein
MNGFAYRITSAVFGNESVRTGCKRLGPHLIVDTHHKNACGMISLPQAAGRLDSVHARHLCIHQHQVRMELLRHAQSLQAVVSLPADLQLGIALDRSTQALADHYVIIGNQYGNRLHGDRNSSFRTRTG